MNKITFEDYKNDIKAHYEAKKINGSYGSGDISNITPAQLRDLCWRISEMGLNKTDESIFRFFFNANEDEKLGKAIQNFGTGKLKSVISFLKEEKDSMNTTRIELTAIIVDYNPRPYNKYLQIGGTISVNNSEILSLNEKYGSDDEVGLAEFTNKNVINKDSDFPKKRTVFILFLSLFLVGYTVKNMFFPTKECMQWNVNCYESVECSNDKLGIGQLNLIIPINESTMKLKKLNSKTELMFFKNDKPLVWYSKEDGVIEIFNQPGFHPETGKPLKPITNYIIDKYGLNTKK